MSRKNTPGVFSSRVGGGAGPPSDFLASTLDPTREFHPIISVYCMIREKAERESVVPGPSGPDHCLGIAWSGPPGPGTFGENGYPRRLASLLGLLRVAGRECSLQVRV